MLLPPDESGDLQLTTCDFGGGLSRQQLFDWAQQRVPAGTSIREVRCGEFSGVCYELIDDRGYWREWILSLAELVLLVNYNCEQGDGERHRAVVDRMLSTLADNRA